MELLRKLRSAPHFGLIAVIVALFVALSFLAPSYPDRETGHQVSTFLNPNTLIQLATDTAFFAILAIGMSMVIITAGIDLSIGSTYALSGVTMAMAVRAWNAGAWPPEAAVFAALFICLGVGLLCGLVNGGLVVALKVHPFVVTLGAMWVFRGIAFVSTKAESILVPPALTDAIKNPLFLGKGLYPIPLLILLVAMAAGQFYLSKTIGGRHVYAVGGNVKAAHYAGVSIPRTLVIVYAVCGLCAGLAAFAGASYFGAMTSSDGSTYELYAIAACVVGGVSLTGGRGSAVGAVLGALLIVTMRQAITTLKLDTNYEWIIIGSALIFAVYLDRLSRRPSKGHQAIGGE